MSGLPDSARTALVTQKREGIMLADADLFKVTKLARSERATAKSITSADNEIIERGYGCRV
jgi:hypothetical protein